MTRIKARKARVLFGRNRTVVRLRGVAVDPQLVVAASQAPGGEEVVLDLVGQLVLRGRDARKAARVLWGRGKVQRDAAGGQTEWRQVSVPGPRVTSL
jgi:hypothetical protein